MGEIFNMITGNIEFRNKGATGRTCGLLVPNYLKSGSKISLLFPNVSPQHNLIGFGAKTKDTAKPCSVYIFKWQGM
jgi:hypothetical protein